MKDTATQPAAQERLWTTKDVAAYFNISKWQVFAFVNEPNGLPCIRLSPKVWRFERSKVIAWGNSRGLNMGEVQN